MYEIEYSKQSIRVLRCMPTNTATLIRRKIETVAQDPFAAPGVNKSWSAETDIGCGLATGAWCVFLTASGYGCWLPKLGHEEVSINEHSNHQP